MATDSPTLDLGAIRARLEAPLGGEAPYTLQTSRWDLRDLLAAYDAQAARRWLVNHTGKEEHQEDDQE